LADEPLTKDEALDTLRILTKLDHTVWLAGGLAADFYVGRWTRDHHDIDLVSFEDDRAALTNDFEGSGFSQTADEGWITRWTRTGREVGEVSLAFMRRVSDDTGELVIRPEHSRGGDVVPGIYPGVPGNLGPDNFRTLEGVSFRLVSAADEWVFTKSFATMHPGAIPDATDHHNVGLLESVLGPEEIERLRPLIGRRRLLEEIDAQS
jgi:hypothetical protein